MWWWLAAMELLRPSWAPRLSALLVLALLPRGALGNCGAPPRLSFAELRDEFKTQTNFTVGTTVRYSCRSGYQKVPGESPTLTCENESVWSEPKEFCRGKSCGHPGDLANGKVHITDLLFGSSVTFSCDEGFRLVGQKTSQCVIDGTGVTWSHEIPLCEKIPCLPPPEIDNGKYLGDPNSHYTYGSTVTYSCNAVPRGTDSFSLIGEASIHCTSDEEQNGVWSGEPPECKVVKCSNVEVKNGRKQSGFGPSYTYKDAITFGCDADYFLVGSNVIICQANGSWTPAIPTCEEIPPSVCGTPPFSNGKIFPSKPRYVTGDRITLTCEANYVLSDGAKSMTVHCKENNVWDPPVQTCQHVCPDLLIPHGTVKSGAKLLYVVGDHVTIECSTFHAMHGEPNIQCTDEFQWKPAIPECKLRVYIIIIIIIVIVIGAILAVWMYKKFFSQKGTYETDENGKEACILNVKVPDENEASALKN
ncbi:membrane cofactor protein-like [Gopherus evgoodei]|uniref:Membrane cofactor protein-like n=1 Tax=Gopherus evgoodei TaxID=1825980 RepID=A0A8C4VQE5_9SAUR|nr:membrane cofactor protein-like [Gopherus evgoodei]